LLKEDLENRVLDFDGAAATEAASLAAAQQKNGRSVDIRDTQIAGLPLPVDAGRSYGALGFDRQMGYRKAAESLGSFEIPSARFYEMKP
jgi:hypothetical protein